MSKSVAGVSASLMLVHALSAPRIVQAAPASPLPASASTVAAVTSSAPVAGSPAAAAPSPLAAAASAPATAGSGSPPPAPLAAAADIADAALDEAAELIEIDDTAPAESASSVHLSRSELSKRSRTQVSDILRQVPGLMVSQHAGGGKADQYFIRGFDADHGTDVAVFADGVPVNLPSHGHGQGYADTHFLIPETIAAVDVHKGPYAARFGDFYTAGALELQTLDSVAAPTVWISGGTALAGPRRARQYNRRLVAMASPRLRDEDSDQSLLAVQIADQDGPFEQPQGFRQGNALAKWRGGLGDGELRLAADWYHATWSASGQVPASAVADHMIGRFGSLDPSEGGDTSRASARVAYALRDTHHGTWRASAFALTERLQLFSNFTLFARDPEHGDEIEQRDARTVWGLDAAYDRRVGLGSADALLTAGVQLRHDDVDAGLWHVARRARLPECFDEGANPCNHTQARIRDAAAYVEANVQVSPKVHVRPGLRVEQLMWEVDDLDPETQRDPAMSTGGSAARAMALPKLSVEIEASKRLDVFANAGRGFHSNDARSSVTTGGAGALARALGAEVGVRTTALARTKLAADVWYLHLASELVWSGDAGGTQPSAATRRYGADLEATYDPLPWLRLDGTLSLARATLVRDAGTGALALAPRITGQGGVTLTGDARFLALRARGVGDRPGNDDGTLTAEGYLIFDVTAGQTLGDLDLNLTINNLLDTQWREAQFADASRVTPSGDVVEQMHFTPGVPLTATLTASYRF